MQKKVSYIVPGMVSLLIIICLVIAPVAAATPFNLQSSAYSRLTSYHSSDSFNPAGLTNHPASGYYVNTARFKSSNTSTFTIAAKTINGLESSSTSYISGMESSSSTYIHTTDSFSWNDHISMRG
jgi:hypothetical protein